MKKFLPLGIILTAVAVAAFYLLNRPAAHDSAAAELVPGETVAFIQIPDLRRSAERWKKTSLYALTQEPEMQSFLERPREKLPLFQHLQTFGVHAERINPREGFLAVTSMEGQVPAMIAGFSFRGSKKDAETFVTTWRADFRKTRPTGRTELTTYGAHEIESFTDSDLTVAECFTGGWYFVANRLELLQQTLDRNDGKGDAATSLARNARFQQTLKPLSEEADALIYSHIGAVTERVLTMLTAAGQKLDPEQIQQLKSAEAIAVSTKIDGANFRDTIFILQPGQPPQTPLARNSLALTSPATLLHYSAALPEKLELPPSAMAALSLVAPGLAGIEAALAKHGLKIGDLSAGLGPELGAVLDWPAGAAQPTFVLAVDVRDAGKARAFVEVIASGGLGTPAWERSEQGGALLYSVPGVGLPMASPTFGLTDRFLTLGLSKESVLTVLGQASAGEKLNSLPAYTTAAGTVVAPTSTFSYIDLRGLVERAYGTFRPFLLMSLAFMPDVGQYVDAGKLPATDTLTRHLGPIVYSQARTDQGTLVESTGPISVHATIVGVLAGTLSAAAPALKEAVSSGLPLNPGTLLNPAPGNPIPAVPAPDPGVPPPEDSGNPAPDDESEAAPKPATSEPAIEA